MEPKPPTVHRFPASRSASPASARARTMTSAEKMLRALFRKPMLKFRRERWWVRHNEPTRYRWRQIKKVRSYFKKSRSRSLTTLIASWVRRQQDRFTLYNLYEVFASLRHQRSTLTGPHLDCCPPQRRWMQCRRSRTAPTREK